MPRLELNAQIDLLISPIGELVTQPAGFQPVHGKEMQAVDRVKDAAIAIASGKIVAAGPRSQVLKQIRVDSDTKLIEAEGRLVTPGLVDPHTHLLFGGNRVNEFLMRCQGKSYAEIAAAGGGIVASMRGTRQSSQEKLLADAIVRLRRMREHGTTTCEIKTGYGLDPETELLLLATIYKLQTCQELRLVPTFMPAHAVPPGVARKEYVQQIVEVMLPMASSIADPVEDGSTSDISKPFVDVFCDEGYFTLDDTRQILEAATALGMPGKVHADEFQPLGATKLAIEMNAASVDHLLKISDQDIELLSRSNTIAVLLPGTSFCLNLSEHAPARKLIDYGAAVALGSDFNAGSCQILSLPFIWGLACLHLKMTPEEALTALTTNAAYALKCGAMVGRAAPGYQADITIYDVPTLEEVPYQMGRNPVVATICSGQIVC